MPLQMGLRRRGINVQTLVEADKLGAGDEELLIFAYQEERVIVTHDNDFLRLASITADHSGVIYGSQQLKIGEMVRKLTLIYQVISAEDMQGHVEFI